MKDFAPKHLRLKRYICDVMTPNLHDIDSIESMWGEFLCSDNFSPLTIMDLRLSNKSPAKSAHAGCVREKRQD